MKTTTLALSLMAALGTGCALAPSTNIVATADLPNCLDANYDAQQNLFTLKNAVPDALNQQCVLSVGPHGEQGSRLAAGRYAISLANGGGGGAGGTPQRGPGQGGGAGGGGAGARETQVTVDLAEGMYRLTIGAGGPGGTACVFAPYYMSGGPGWAGSPSSIVHIGTGNVVAGTPGADTYARPSRARHELSAGKMDGHGGSGPGQTSGGRGGTFASATGATLEAQSGQSARTAVASAPGPASGAVADAWRAGGGGGGATIRDEGSRFNALSSAGFDAPTASISSSTGARGMGGIPGGNEDRSTAGGGGGATSRSDGGGGGGEKPGNAERPPQRGTLGSGGGGGEGSRYECDAGARGGHGYIGLRRI